MTDAHRFRKLENLSGHKQFCFKGPQKRTVWRVGCAVVYMPGLGSEGDEIALYDDDSKQYKVILFVHDKRRVLPSGPKHDQ